MSDNTLEIGQVRVGWCARGIESRCLFQWKAGALQILQLVGGLKGLALVMTQSEQNISMTFLKICILLIIMAWFS